MVSTPKLNKKAAAKPENLASTAPVALQKKVSGAMGAARIGNTPRQTSSAIKSAGSKPVSASNATVPAMSSGPTEVALPNAAKSQSANALKKKDLIDRVLAVTGAKKKLVREIVEATLTVLGDALSKGEMLNIPPFGKAKVSRQQDAGTHKAMTVKLRRTTGGGQGGANAKQALADAEE